MDDEGIKAKGGLSHSFASGTLSGGSDDTSRGTGRRPDGAKI